MGLFSRIRDPVEGSYQLTACSMNSGGAVYENCSMDGVVTGPGITPTAVHHSTMAPTKKWPQPGTTLPVTVDRSHPERIKIRWHQIPTSADVARRLSQQQAQQMADQMGQGIAASAAPFADAGVPPQFSSMFDDLIKRAEAAGAQVTVSTTGSVAGDPGRAAPGQPGGGLTPEESAQVASGGAAALGLQATTARVLAAHEVPVPAGVPGVAPGGAWDLTLDVVGNPGYTTVLRVNFSSPARRQSIAAVGRELPVFADPTRHDRIAIDTQKV